MFRAQRGCLTLTTDDVVYLCDQWCEMVVLYSEDVTFLPHAAQSRTNVFDFYQRLRPLVSGGSGALCARYTHGCVLVFFWKFDSVLLHGFTPSVEEMQCRAWFPFSFCCVPLRKVGTR